MREKELIVYKDFGSDTSLLMDMVWLMEHYGSGEEGVQKESALLYDCMHGLLEMAGSHGFSGNLWHCYLTNLLVNNENSYSRACEIRGKVEGTINEAVLHDIIIFKEFFDYDFTDMMEKLQVPAFSLVLSYEGNMQESKVYNTRIRDRICTLAVRFKENRTPEEMKDTLTEFYKEYGVGKFGLHKAFRISHKEDETLIEPILNIAHVQLGDLIGYETAKKKLVDNTEAFVKGKKANNCLLYGDAGTGKSSSIKAIANAYYSQGLRIIEVYKHQFQDLNNVIAQIKNRNYKFIIYMDDLSFEDFEIEYKYLKAVIEGGLEKKPANVLIYATSNRRHLVREKFSDKRELDDDLHNNDTVQEKLSLVSRFGVTIYFGAPDKSQFQDIVKALAARYGLTMPEEELLAEANKWELFHGGFPEGRRSSSLIICPGAKALPAGSSEERKGCGVKTFAAIDVGSYELSMKIFEFSPKIGIREIDHIRHRIDLGNDTFATGKISYEKVDELCRVLREFVDIMRGYKVEDFKAYGTSAIRETENTMIVLDQIRQRTGIRIEVLSNSEQRFLDYKSIALKGQDFNKIIEKGTAIVDIGGGSIQVSLFDKDTLVATQNLRLGVLRLQELLNKLNAKPSKYEGLLEEIIESQLSVFKRMYLKDRTIDNIIIVDDYVSALIQKRLTGSQTPGYVDSASYEMFMQIMRTHTKEEIAARFGISTESIPLIFISAVLIYRVALLMEAKLLWAPGVTLCDGIAYEFAEKNKIVGPKHDFEQDIVACARNISKRFMGSRRRGETLEYICTTIFDSMKKVHGLGKRERLLLRIAALLHDCGKYISMVNLGECSYSIVMATEIIGLSHKEREIVANVVKYNHQEFDYYEELGTTTTLDPQAYLTIAKLTAIIRVANGLDRSHKQKFKDFKTTLREDQLIFTVNTAEDITLERGLFEAKASFFEEVFSVHPVIKQKKII